MQKLLNFFPPTRERAKTAQGPGNATSSHISPNNSSQLNQSLQNTCATFTAFSKSERAEQWRERESECLVLHTFTRRWTVPSHTEPCHPVIQHYLRLTAQSLHAPVAMFPPGLQVQAPLSLIASIMAPSLHACHHGGLRGRIKGLCLTAGLSCSEGQPSWGSSPSRQLSLTNRPAVEHGLGQISQTPLHQRRNRRDVEGHPLMRMMITSSVGEKTPPNCTCPELQQEYIYTDRQTKAFDWMERFEFKSQHTQAAAVGPSSAQIYHKEL